MRNVLQFRPAIPGCDTTALLAARSKFSFDISQPDGRGLVLIDACVPLALATEFMRLVALHRGD